MNRSATPSFTSLLAELDVLDERSLPRDAWTNAEKQIRQSEIFQKMLQCAAIALQDSSQTD